MPGAAFRSVSPRAWTASRPGSGNARPRPVCPSFRTPPTARALYAGIEIGAAIEPDHYRAVAAAIRFADLMRQKARRRARP
uniref:EscU/YscU/HrcU family type III secretion system export apparatus switch protein n=1 Tax=Roseicyclus elongatus TaxID=159346 RepID=UPI00316AC2AA